jgi:hypothetical protein
MPARPSGSMVELRRSDRRDSSWIAAHRCVLNGTLITSVQTRPNPKENGEVFLSKSSPMRQNKVPATTLPISEAA